MKRARSDTFLGWRIVGGAWFIYFMSGGLFNTGTVYFKALAEDLSLGRGQLSAMFSLGFVIAGMGGPVWGRVVDKKGPRAAFVPAAVGTGIACAMLGGASGFASLCSVYALLTFSSAGISLIPISVLVSNWFVENRGRAIGVAYTGEGFGALIMVPAAAALIAALGWRMAYVVSGVAVAALVTPVAFWMSNRPQDVGLLPDGADPSSSPAASDARAVAGGRQHEARGLSRGAALRTGAFWVVAIAWFTAMMPLAAVSIHQVPFLTDAGLSLESAALVAGGVGGAGIIGRLGYGLLSDRYPIRRVYASCYLLMGAGVAALWMSAQLGAIALILYVGLFGIAVGGAFALAGLLVAVLFGDNALGELFGFLGLAATLGGALGGTAAGVLFDRFGTYDEVFAACIGLCLLATVLMLAVPTPHR